MNDETPHVAVDCLMKTPKGFVFIKRRNDPFRGMYALPGGFIDIGESVEEACVREVKEETNIDLNVSDLCLIGVYSRPARDPRRQVISIAYYAKSEGFGLKAGDDASDVFLVSDISSIRLAFDHSEIVTDAIAKFISHDQKAISL